jgi:ABC-type sulfate/molybdate transport systems ATPase subunit
MLQVKNISFGYNKIPVLKNISFNVGAGEHVSIIGESGSGKTTLLKLIYGEHDVNQGHIFWQDTEILGPKFNLVTGSDYMKYVAQEFDLMPFTTVEENVGGFLSNFYPKDKQERTHELLNAVQLHAFAKTKVKNLSGGQKQRVALARAIAKQPEILLLDEPFSHIDNFKKQSLRRSLFNYLKEKNISCIVATHDKEDVLPYANNMIVLSNGEIIASDMPQNLYANPKTPLIASFFETFNEIDNFGIVYANQLKVVDNSNLGVVVKQSYLKGNHYLIEANFNGQDIFFENQTDLAFGAEISLSISR